MPTARTEKSVLGCARRERHEARKQSVAAITEALSKAPRFVFTEEGDAWTQLSTTDMSPEDLAAAQECVEGSGRSRVSGRRR